MGLGHKKSKYKNFKTAITKQNIREESKKMVTIIIMALTLALLQIWIIPMTGALVINFKSMSYLLSNRDSEITIDPASVSARILRASSNLQESLPAFLTLAILSIITNVDNTMYAMTWVFLRFLYLLVYAAGILYIRTVVWPVSYTHLTLPTKA